VPLLFAALPAYALLSCVIHVLDVMCTGCYALLAVAIYVPLVAIRCSCLPFLLSLRQYCSLLSACCWPSLLCVAPFCTCLIAFVI